MTAAMLPINDLSPPAEAHPFMRGLTLAHFDATLRANEAAAGWLARLDPTFLIDRGVHAYVERSS